MIGITSYGAYIPMYRIARETFLKAWGGFGAPGEKAIAGYDEDSVTMAVEASMDCLRGIDSKKVDGLFFATTTSPYKEKQVSALMGFPLDLRPDIRTADITTSLRAGTTAIGLAHDIIKAGSANSILVAAADSRMGAPAGSLEQNLGDSAAALLLGSDNVIAEIQGSYSIWDELAGTWRGYDDTFVRSWEDRMVLEEGYSRVLPEAIAGFMKKYGLAAKDFTKVVFDPSTDIRRHGRVAAKLGFEPSQVQDATKLFMNMGISGTAMPLMMLVAALEEAKPGDKILFAGYGNGADVFMLQVTDAIAKLPERRGITKHLESKRMLDNYTTYLRWRDLVPLEAARRPAKGPIAVSANWRARKVLLGLWGIKCNRCGTPQYDNGGSASVPMRVCGVCQAEDDFEEYNFARSRATVFSFTKDMLGAGIDPPSVVVMVEFEGGGRCLFDLTDRDPDEVKMGMEVEMTFRKVYFEKGLSNYFWKARPIRF